MNDIAEKFSNGLKIPVEDGQLLLRQENKTVVNMLIRTMF